jgi:cytochrome c-type biogenesis protein CcmH
MRLLFLALALIFGMGPAFADSNLPPARYANQPLADRAQEEKAQALMHTLRCLVCQNQTIADSNAEMAGDMRALVRERIAAGDEPEAVRQWLIERYGEWVSYRPPVEPATWLLWGAPVLFIAIGAAIIARYYRRGRS